MNTLFKELKNDLPASIIVFFVALPLCLGIALASGAPLFAGIIAGIIGGIVVGIFSGSSLGVSGPAAGLAVIVLSAISKLGSWELFLVAIIISGIIQVALGYAKAGFIAYFFPSSVIKGMLTGIGLLIILKQIPHALGWDNDTIGDESFLQTDGTNTFSAIFSTFNHITPGAILISITSLATLIFWNKYLLKKSKIFQIIQGPIVVVLVGILINYLFQNNILNFNLSTKQLVSLPVPTSLTDFFYQFRFPDLAALHNIEVYKIGFILAIVGSLETLLSVEAADRLDPEKRITPTNRELKAQGIGNIISGLIGGLPITQVIVRTSANVSFGAKTKLSAILHGFLLLISVLTISSIMNKIPLASLSAILIMVGYKLAKPNLLKKMYSLGWEQFVPFMATVIMILVTDLLKGIVIGMFFGIFYTLRHSYRNSHHLKEIKSNDNNGQELHYLELAQEVSFLNKASIMETLYNIPQNSKVTIDFSKSKSVAYDVLEIIKDYEIHAKNSNITVEKINYNPKNEI
jgi:SulP family sulfate permease